MKQLAFEQQNQALWQAFERQLQQLESKRTRLAAEQARQFGGHYSQVCHHLALANDRQYSGGLASYLQKIGRAHV